MKVMTSAIFMAVLCMAIGCAPEEGASARKPSLDVHYTIMSDKVAYPPGESVNITVTPPVAETLHVRFMHLGEVIDEGTINGSSFRWDPPADDFKGYMMELCRLVEEGKEAQVVATMGIDVSSVWTKFPRYGFLSKYPEMTKARINEVIDNLARYHINGIQFYDWHYKHHQPLAGTPESPTPVYRDIINREIHFQTVKGYIDAAHARNMQAMYYNLVYGALKDAASQGVKEQWYLFTDPNRITKDKHPLSAPFTSDIFLVDPSNPSWQDYLIRESRKVYAALPFNGYHMDQLGDRGLRYNYDGQPVDLSQSFKAFIEAVDADDPTKYNVLNAVNQYGQLSIAKAPVDFLYSEVWSPNDTYADLAEIIQENNKLSEQRLNTVLAAYVNYDLANSPGSFHTPSVLMANAVIFAFGGAHLELGEHMLGKEYFPNDNLAMTDELKRRLVYFYDFLVAYQNLLRDGGVFNSPALISHDNKVQFTAWPPQAGRVAVVGKKRGNRQVMHLLNFVNATTMQWRDNSGIQAAPATIENLQVRFTPDQPVKKIWAASPDYNLGAGKSLAFIATGDQVTFTVPTLQYWSMIVIEYQ